MYTGGALPVSSCNATMGRTGPGLGRLVAGDATPPAFEKHIGRIEEIEARWYAYLLDLQKNLAGRTTPGVRLGSTEASGGSSKDTY